MSVRVNTAFNTDARDLRFHLICHQQSTLKEHVYTELQLQVAMNMRIYQRNASNVNMKDETRKGFVFVALQYMEMQDFHYKLFMLLIQSEKFEKLTKCKVFFSPLCSALWSYYITLIQSLISAVKPTVFL